jgi:glycerol-3-phosphate dehydrogenase
VAPDCSIDFAAFLAFLRAHLVNTQVIVPAKVTRLLEDRQNNVCAVLYQHTGDEVLLKCRWCIVSAGAWTVELLQESFGISLPVKRFKSHIVTFEGRLVDKITAFLDGTQITLVPIKSRTLVANARRVLAEDASAAHTPITSEVTMIQEQLAQAFPRLRWSAVQTQLVDGHGCLKTEATERASQRNQHYALFDEQSHGIGHLVVAFPGKASLMLQLGQELAARVMALQEFRLRRPA